MHLFVTAFFVAFLALNCIYIDLFQFELNYVSLNIGAITFGAITFTSLRAYFHTFSVHILHICINAYFKSLKQFC